MQRLNLFATRAWPGIVGLVYLLAAWPSIELLRSAHGIATMWAPSGVLLAALLVSPRTRTAWLLLYCAAACLVANLFAGSGIAQSIGYTLANMTEAVVATWLLRRDHAPAPSFLTPREFGRFCAAVAVSALAGGGVATLVDGLFDGSSFVSWVATDALGTLIVTPMILTGLAAWHGEKRATAHGATAFQAVMLFGLVTAVSCAVFSQSSYPLLFLPLVALLGATYRLGPFGAAMGVSIVAVVGSTFTALGDGPLVLVHVHHANIVWFLQFYIATLFATALPLAALLAAQATLMDECAESERVHRLLADRSRDIVARLDLAGAPLYVTPACRRVLGWEPDEVIGVRRIDFIHPDDRAEVIRIWTRLLASEPDPSCIYRERRRDGTYVWLEATYNLVRDPATGAPLEVVASIRDISARRSAEIAAAAFSTRVEERNRLLSMAERIAGVGHWRLDPLSDSIFWSPEVYRIHGVDPSTALRLADGLSFYHPDDLARITGIVDASIADATGFLFDARIIRCDGEVRNVVTRGEPELAADGTLVAIVGVIQDVTQQVAVQRQLEAARLAAEDAARDAMLIADTDTLTGIASRRKTLRFLADALEAARETGGSLSIATFDIDRFKTINDRFGHATGDDVLVRVAQVAQSSVRAGDLIGRIGGEEFLVVLPGSDATLAVKVAERLRAAVENAAGAFPPSAAVTISVGVAQFSLAEGSDGDLAALLHRADCALYAAKQAGRNKLQLAA